MAQRSFYYSPLAEKTLEWLVRATRAKNGNAVFESSLHAALDRVLSVAAQEGAPAMDEELALEGASLARAWDQVEQAIRTLETLQNPPEVMDADRKSAW